MYEELASRLVCVRLPCDPGQVTPSSSYWLGEWSLGEIMVSQASALIYRTPLTLLLVLSLKESNACDFYLAPVASAILRLDWQSQESKVTRVVEKRIVSYWQMDSLSGGYMLNHQLF